MSSPQPLPAEPLSLNVLLLEDDPMDAELLTETLRRSSELEVAIHWVSDEASYARALEDGGHDVVLSDFSLPSFSGAEALERALQLAPGIPFIIISGVMGEEIAVEMLKAGATDYLLKSRLQRLPYVLRRAMREVSERRQRLSVEQALRESNTVYSRLVESLRDYAVLLIDPEGRIRAWNNASETMFGWSRDEVIGRHAGFLFHEKDRAAGVFEQELQHAVSHGRTSDDRWLVRKSGESFFATGVTTILHGDDGRLMGFSKIVRDGTQAQEVALAMQTAKDEAERANRAKDRFLAVLSHELRTPLMPISAAADVLERRLSLPDDLKNLVTMIRRNVALEARLIDDLLDLTSIDHGKLNLQSRPVDIQVLISAVLDMLGDDILGKRLWLTKDLAPGSLMVMGDASRLQQILWNVVRNAIKFTPPNGSVTVRSRLNAGRVEVSCQDTGIGIKAEALQRLFMPFEQVDPQITQKFGGLGLGMAIAQGLAVAQGGELWADSPGPGLGATFTLSMSAAHVQDHHLPVGPQGVHSSRNAPRWSVLLVEDNQDSADALSMALDMQGYDVIHANSVQDALQKADAHDFDAVVSDLGLPDGSGRQVALGLAHRFPCIALSGYGSDDDVDASREAGFSGHLTKPVDPDDIDTLLRALIAERAAESPLGR